METWFLKSLVATLSIVPAFLAIPFFRSKLGVDPLVFLVWYFGATAASIAGVLAIGLTFGALANGSLFQAIGSAPNPGLPPVIYASSSVIVFMLSALLARSVPSLFPSVSTELSRLGGMALVLLGLYLLGGGRLPDLLRG